VSGTLAYYNSIVIIIYNSMLISVSSEVHQEHIRQPVDTHAHYSPWREASLLPVVHNLLQILLFSNIQAIAFGFLAVPVIHHIGKSVLRDNCDDKVA